MKDRTSATPVIPTWCRSAMPPPGASTPSPARSVTARFTAAVPSTRSEEHTSELQSLMRISYAVFCLKKKRNTRQQTNKHKYGLQVLYTERNIRRPQQQHPTTLK